MLKTLFTIRAMTTTRRARVRDCPDLRMMTIRSGIAPTFKYTCIVWVAFFSVAVTGLHAKSVCK